MHSGGLWYTGKWTTDELLENFREGAAVKVRVDPSAPGRARLEGAGAMDWRAGAFFLGLAVFILILNKSSEDAPASGQGYAGPDPRGAPPAQDGLAPKRPRSYAAYRYERFAFALLGIVIFFIVNFLLLLRR